MATRSLVTICGYTKLVLDGLTAIVEPAPTTTVRGTIANRGGDQAYETDDRERSVAVSGGVVERANKIWRLLVWV
jgi:hypothetical protein